MKRITILILIILLAVQTFGVWATVIAFNIQRDYISRNICENRFRPELACHGNCVLMKRMKQEQQQEENNKSSLKLNISPEVISSKSFYNGYELRKPEQIDPDHKFPLSIGSPIDRSFPVFRPPVC